VREYGWISLVSVLPSWRRRGLGSAILRAVMRALFDEGCREIGLGVDSDNATGAVGIYERAGFRVVQSITVWRKVLKVGTRAARDQQSNGDSEGESEFKDGHDPRRM